MARDFVHLTPEPRFLLIGLLLVDIARGVCSSAQMRGRDRVLPWAVVHWLIIATRARSPAGVEAAVRVAITPAFLPSGQGKRSRRG